MKNKRCLSIHPIVFYYGNLNTGPNTITKEKRELAPPLEKAWEPWWQKTVYLPSLTHRHRPANTHWLHMAGSHPAKLTPVWQEVILTKDFFSTITLCRCRASEEACHEGEESICQALSGLLVLTWLQPVTDSESTTFITGQQAVFVHFTTSYVPWKDLLPEGNKNSPATENPHTNHHHWAPWTVTFTVLEKQQPRLQRHSGPLRSVQWIYLKGRIRHILKKRRIK